MDMNVVRSMMFGYSPIGPMHFRVEELRANLLALAASIQEHLDEEFFVIREAFDSKHNHLEELFFYCTKDFPNTMPIKEFPSWYRDVADVVMGPGDVASKVGKILDIIK